MGPLTGRGAVVTGADQPLGRGLTLALGAAGAALTLIGDPATLAPVTADLDHRDVSAVAVAAPLTDRAALEQGVAAAADRLDAPVRAVVHAAMPAAAFERVAFDDVDDDRLDTVWEGTMRAALAVLQASHTLLSGRDGRIVLVTPTVSMSGAPGLVPYAAAVEGQRLLAKSAARQWGSDRITVNCLAPSPELVPIGVTSGDASLAPAALGGPGDPEADLGPILVFLAGDDSHFVTGVTVCADGGVWMAP